MYPPTPSSFRPYCVLLALLLAALAYVPAATAQSFLHENEPTTEVSLEWIKPFFSDADGLSFFSSVAHVTARVAFTPRFTLVGSIPIAHLGIEAEVGDVNLSETNPGNGYLGFQYYGAANTWRVGAGARLPLAADDASALGIGFLADYDHLEAYVPDLLTISAEGAAFYGANTGLRLETMLRPALLFFTGEGEADNEVFIHYGARAWYTIAPVHVGLGLSGVMVLTEAELSFSERNVPHATLYLAGDVNNLRPGVFLRLPLDEEISEDVDFIVGVGLSIMLED